MQRLLLLTLLLTGLVLPPAALAQTLSYQTGDPADWPPELDAVTAAPDNHTVLLENDHVRVLEVQMAPRELENLHHHQWPSVLYIMEAGHFIDRDANGEVIMDTRELDRPLPLPLTMWKDPEAPHAVESLSDGPVRLIRVELKQAGPVEDEATEAQRVLAAEDVFGEAEVMRASADHVAAINRQDLDAFVGSLTESVVMSLPDGSQLTGHNAIREVAASLFAAGTVSITSETQEIQPMGNDFVYQRAAVATRLDGALLDQGIGTYIWTRTPDGWKIARDTWTSAPVSRGTN